MFPRKGSQMTITEFYAGKSIFITGSTGFIGRLLVEKLLRECPDIKNIYVLLRPKKGKSAKDRISDIIDIPIFDKIRDVNKEALNKIIAIPGDTEKVHLGMSEEDRQTIIENVTIIYHVAASIRFDDHLRDAVFVNTRSQRDAAILATQLKKVDVFVDTSTAYSNCDKLKIEEKVYPAKIDYRDLIRMAEEGDQETLEKLTQKIIYPMPNTYTFTKSVGEAAVVDITKGIVPTVIARPSIVKPTFCDPAVGWVDNLNGEAVFHIGSGRGVVRVFYGVGDNLLDGAFADNVVKAMIIASWKKGLSGDKDEVSVYNMATDIRIAIKKMMQEGVKYAEEHPLDFYIWPPALQITRFFWLYYFAVIYKQVFPAFLVDLILIIKGQRPKLWNIQKKVFKANTVLFYFMSNTWTFAVENYRGLMMSLSETEAEAFSLNIFGPDSSQKVMSEYLRGYFIGCRKYLLLEAPIPLEVRLKTLRRIKLVIKVVQMFLVGIIMYYIFFKLQLLSIVANKTDNYFRRLDSTL